MKSQGSGAGSQHVLLGRPALARCGAFSIQIQRGGLESGFRDLLPPYDAVLLKGQQRLPVNHQYACAADLDRTLGTQVTLHLDNGVVVDDEIGPVDSGGSLEIGAVVGPDRDVKPEAGRPEPDLPAGVEDHGLIVEVKHKLIADLLLLAVRALVGAVVHLSWPISRSRELFSTTHAGSRFPLGRLSSFSSPQMLVAESTVVASGWLSARLAWRIVTTLRSGLSGTFYGTSVLFLAMVVGEYFSALGAGSVFLAIFFLLLGSTLCGANHANFALTSRELLSTHDTVLGHPGTLFGRGLDRALHPVFFSAVWRAGFGPTPLFQSELFGTDCANRQKETPPSTISELCNPDCTGGVSFGQPSRLSH